jgi:hypothetical protein
MYDTPPPQLSYIFGITSENVFQVWFNLTIYSLVHF